jgi:quercetin dioxygenase-like cupin family protein
MRRTAIFVAIVLPSVFSSLPSAFATPPTGDIKFTDRARVQLADSAKVPIRAGTDLVMGMYSIAADGDTGWRSLPGAMVLAVTKGTLTVQGGDGCAAREYTAGQAATVPPGTYRVHNSGTEPLDFFGAFFNQAPGGPKPLTEGPVESAPADCPAISAAEIRPTGVSLDNPSAGTIYAGFYNLNATLEIKSGLDLLAAHYEIAPGWNSGWISHLPAINIVESGTLSYAEARNGQCDTREEYSTGQAFYHPAHRHMAFNKTDKPVMLTTVYFNLPHETPLPVVGNQTTAVDFTQPPPADCPRLR